MEKIFEIASSITHPISLIALFFLILYLLYKGIIAKVGEQKGTKGYLILKQLMKTVAVIAIVTLVLVFAFRAYEVYTKVDDLPELNEMNEKLENNNNEIKKIDSTSQKIIKKINKDELTVQFTLEKFTDCNLLIGNTGGKIILMKNLKIHWNYSECRQFKEPMMAQVIAEYRYYVNISKESGSKIIDTKDFKYGAGDIDKFLVNITYPGLGIYTVWFTFEYSIFGSDQRFLYTTNKDTIENCEKFN